jgi:hypothetical protein
LDAAAPTTMVSDTASDASNAATQDAGAGDGGAQPISAWPDGGYELIGTGAYCTLEPVRPGLALVPVQICDWESLAHERRICSTDGAIECARASDCTAHPFGRCEGAVSSQCKYPHVGNACAVDADCTELPNGVCIPEISSELLCDAQGNNCHQMGPYCHYLVLNEVCTSDADCDDAPDGYCDGKIWRTSCVYLGCEDNDDCNTGERCACHHCVTAECSDDIDCGKGEQCLQGNPCGRGTSGGFYCTRPGDGCRLDRDCADGFCDYDIAAKHFACSQRICEVP